MTTLYCAECRCRFEPDDDHVRIDAEIRRIDDRNDRDDYVMCLDCWHDLTGEWVDPA